MSFELQVLEASLHLFDKMEQAILHVVGTSLRSRHPEVAREVGEQLKRAMDVHQIVEKVRLGKINQEEISSAMKLVERLEKKQKKLFKERRLRRSITNTRSRRNTGVDCFWRQSSRREKKNENKRRRTRKKSMHSNNDVPNSSDLRVIPALEPSSSAN